MTNRLDGTLEIDNGRGVIYFHCNDGTTILRICRLPIPIPNAYSEGTPLVITYGVGTSWSAKSGGQ